jgi:Zn-finger nucleic acid-binding protein
MQSALSPHACPRCSRQLHVAQVSGVTLHGCGACGGLWLDNASTGQVLARINPQVVSLAQVAAKNAPQKVDLQASIRCPACTRELRRVPGGDPSLLIDICEEHGTWFDRDELQQVSALAEKRRREQLTAGVAGVAVAGAAGVAVAGAMAAQQASSGNLGASASDALSNLDAALAHRRGVPIHVSETARANATLAHRRQEGRAPGGQCRPPVPPPLHSPTPAPRWCTTHADGTRRGRGSHPAPCPSPAGTGPAGLGL